MQVKLEGDINQGVAYYKKALYYNWHYADAMYNLGVAYGEMLEFEMVIGDKNHVIVQTANCNRKSCNKMLPGLGGYSLSAYVFFFMYITLLYLAILL